MKSVYRKRLMEPVKYGSWSFLQKNLWLKAENNFAKSSIFDVLKDPE